MRHFLQSKVVLFFGTVFIVLAASVLSYSAGQASRPAVSQPVVRPYATSTPIVQYTPAPSGEVHWDFAQEAHFILHAGNGGVLYIKGLPPSATEGYTGMLCRGDNCLAQVTDPIVDISYNFQTVGALDSIMVASLPGGTLAVLLQATHADQDLLVDVWAIGLQKTHVRPLT